MFWKGSDANHIIYKTCNNNTYNYKIFVKNNKKYIRTKNGQVSFGKIIAWQKRKQMLDTVYVGGYATCYAQDLLKDLLNTYKIKNNITVQKDSGNCVFSIIESKFLKIQLDTKSDDILVDAYNSIMINTLMKKYPMYAAHFVMYFDSFPIPLIITNNTYQLSPTHNTCYNSILYKAINCPSALKDIIAINNTYIETDNVRKLSNLFRTLFDIGQAYQFVHNDLHTGNILLDTKINEFVIIDYGRVFFGNPPKGEIEIQQRDKLELYYLNRPDIIKCNYKDFLQNIINSNDKPSYHWINSYLLDDDVFKTHMVMFDITSVTLQCLPIIYKHDNIVILKKDINNRSLYEILSKDEISKIAHIKPNPYLPGLYWFSMFCELIDEAKQVENRIQVNTCKYISGTGIFYNIKEKYGNKYKLDLFMQRFKENAVEFNNLVDLCFIHSSPSSSPSPSSSCSTTGYASSGSSSNDIQSSSGACW